MQTVVKDDVTVIVIGKRDREILLEMLDQIGHGIKPKDENLNMHVANAMARIIRQEIMTVE